MRIIKGEKNAKTQKPNFGWCEGERDDKFNQLGCHSFEKLEVRYTDRHITGHQN